MTKIAEISPCVLPTTTYKDIFDYQQHMAHCSYIPMHTKRAVVIACLARIDRFTVPDAAKPLALQAPLVFLCILSSVGCCPGVVDDIGSARLCRHSESSIHNSTILTSVQD